MYIKQVNKVVNRQIFNRVHLHEEDDSGWKVPLTPNRKEVGEVSMDDSTAKLFEKNMDYLIDVCLGNHSLGIEYVTDWKDCMVGYRQVFAMMSSRHEATFEDVCMFVLESDAFMERYVALTGRDGMTNYFHMLRDGHIAYYMRTYGNLYRLSQQGWENINSVMKRTFHRGTQRGGSKKGTSKIRPVFLRMIRAALWRMGHLCGFFKHFGNVETRSYRFGDVSKLPKFKNVSTDELRNYSMTILKFGDLDFLNTINEEMDTMESLEDNNIQFGSV